jgi:hypothetical protein
MGQSAEATHQQTFGRGADLQTIFTSGGCAVKTLESGVRQSMIALHEKLKEGLLPEPVNLGAFAR